MGFHIYSNGGAPYDVPAGTPAVPGVMPVPLTFTAASLLAENFTGTDTVSDDLNTALNLPFSFVFIRFVMLNDGLAAPAPANRPTLRLTIGGSVATPIVAPSIGINDPATGGAQDATAYLFGPNADNVYLVKVLIETGQDFWPAPWNWIVEILNRDANLRRFVVVFGGTSAESRQSWLHLSPTSMAFSALVNDTAALTEQAITLKNLGTGPLSGLAFNPAVAAPFAADPLPGSVAPNGSANVGVGFAAPGAIGTVGATAFTLQSNDPGASAAPLHNHALSLSATTHRIETTMVLDVSGSMNAQPNGIYGGPANNTRLSVMKSAAKLAGDTLSALAAGKGTLGLVRFPGINSADITTYSVAPPVVKVPIPNLGGNTVNTPVNALTVGGMTPLRLGLQWASTGGFYETEASAPQSTTLNERWLLLMTDGDWNEGGNPHPTMTAELGGKRIKVFAMGYGTGGEYNPAILSTIATGAGSFAGGQVIAINTLLDPANQAVTLANAFKNAVKAMLSSSVEAPRDPAGVLTSSDGEQRHSIIITPYDSKAVFLINWNTSAADRMSLRLLSPTCDLITPESAAAGEHPGVTFSGSERHQLFSVDQSYLENVNADGVSSPRYGTWHMVVSSDELSDDDSEHFSYDCIVVSALRMEATLERGQFFGQYFAGDTINVRASLTLKGRPLAGASVRVRVTRPGQAFTNWLATARVSRGDLAQARDLMQGNEATPIYLKAVAATQVLGLKFYPGGFSRTITLTDPDGDGVYSGSFSDTSVPETYTFEVTAVGTTEDGVVYRRERELKTVLGVRPLPEFTIFDIRYVSLVDNPDRYRAVINVTPRDRFGNLLLYDPAQGNITLDIDGGALDADLTTDYDGTYSAPLSFDRGAAPRVALRVDDEAVFQGRPVVRPDKLTYVDQIFDYRPGGVRKLDSNRFANPQAMLGDITQRPDDSFLALGGHGSIIVGVQGHMIMASDEADVTVFAPPQIERRPYLVEALATSDKPLWVTLGESDGGSDSFSLKAAGLEAALAVRISDRSGRTSDEQLEPLEAPGAVLRGVGVSRVGRGGKGNLLRNPEFALMGPDGPLVSAKVVGYGPVSAAADWIAYALRDAEVATELMSGPGPREAPTILRVAVNAEGGGIAQVFDGQNRGPKRVVVSAWVYVVRGRVGLGAGAGKRTEPSVFSDGAGRWELLSTRNASAPVSQIVLLAAEEGTIFYVAYAELIEADLA